MGVTRSAISVRFHGEDVGGVSGVGELTWGQQGIWETIQRTGRTLNIGGALPMPAGTSAEEIATMLRFWVSRHPSLRTRLRFAPHTQQVVAESGELPLHVLDVDGPDDPSVAAESLRVEFETPAFAYATEFPVRMGVVRRDGEVTHMVVQYCHLAVDGGAIDAMVRDLECLDRKTGTGGVSADGLNPLELARIQCTPAGLRPSVKSLRYWQEQLHDVPSRRFAEPGEGCEPRFWELCLYSPAMYLALKSIAARTETNTTHVLFAAYAV
ncbi:MAG TPA: condensation domain-containing protein, partial [Micromonosporaceae bacterium]